jgi:hypothetical protein
VVLDATTGQVLALANGGDADRATGDGGGNPAVTSRSSRVRSTRS